MECSHPVLFYKESLKYRVEMLMKGSLIIVLGCCSVAYAEIPFCSGDLCFIRPDPNSGNAWLAAQQKCKENNSTLPIADNSDHWKSFVDALSHFSLSSVDVWLGANASDYGPDNWRWLDRSQYSGDDVQERGEYYKSYAYVAKSSTKVLAYASAPNNSYSYLCQYNIVTPDVCTNGTGKTFFIRNTSCYVKYDEKMSWFSARNNCLAKGGDLASFTQLSLLDGIIDSSGFWVGLRHSQWIWQNAVTSSSSNVTFTSWRIGQPNGPAPQCIATDFGDFPNWKDAECNLSFFYICQVIPPPATQGSSFSISSTTTTANSVASSSSTMATISTITASLSFGTPGSTGLKTDKSASSQRSSSENNHTPLSNPVSSSEINTNLTKSGSENDGRSMNNSLAIGLGLGIGLGVPVIILIVVVIVVVVRRKHRNSITNGYSQSRKGFVFNRRKASEKDTTEMNETNNSVGQYATVNEATGFDTDEKLDPPSNKVTEYADLQFVQGQF